MLLLLLSTSLTLGTTNINATSPRLLLPAVLPLLLQQFYHPKDGSELTSGTRRSRSLVSG
jgi:hypothetical protein